MKYIKTYENNSIYEIYIRAYEDYAVGYEYFNDLGYDTLSTICYCITLYLESIQPLFKNGNSVCMWSSDDLTFIYLYRGLSEGDLNLVINFIEDKGFKYIKHGIDEGLDEVTFSIPEDKMLEIYELQSSINNYNI